MNIKNIKIKILIWYSTIVLIVLATLAVSVVYVFGEGIYDSIEELEHILFISIPIIVLLFIISGWFIIGDILKRVQNIINEVNAIQGSDLDKRLSLTNSSDEIEELIITFNSMLNRIDRSFSKVKRFSHDVSHELKTPLTVLRGEMELGLRKTRTIKEYKNILNISLEELQQLQELIDSLLFLSNSNQQDIVSSFEEVQVDETLLDVVSEYRVLLDGKNITIEFLFFNSVITNAHPILLKILIKNIISNSIKYSNKNSKIEISLDKEKLIITDHGIGIKEEDLKNVFDRFYRVDTARSRGGYGLGLSIVENISILHGFKVNLQSKLGLGSTFYIYFNNK